MQRLLLILGTLVCTSILFWSCARPPAKTGGKSTPDACGECLNAVGGKVCTPVGTMTNACFAVCREKLIVCRQECPCPKEQ